MEPCSWEQILATWPDAGIWNDDTGLVLFKAGGSAAWANFDGNVDNFTIILADSSSFQFDFEPPAEVYVDDDWATETMWTDPNDGDPPFYMGLDGFTSIQDAIDVVQVGGTVNVAAGTYAENNITIAKSLELLGAGAASTSITPGAGTAGSLIEVLSPGGDVTISGFTLNIPLKTEANSGAGILVSDTGAVDDNTVFIQNNIFNGSNDGINSYDFGIYGYDNNAHLVITGNTFFKIGTNTFLMELQRGTSQVTSNTITLADDARVDAYYGMTYADNDITTPQIVSGNTFHMGTPADISTAISFASAELGWSEKISTDTGHYRDIQIQNNIFDTFAPDARAIGVYDMSWNGTGGLIEGVVITGNKVIGANKADVNTHGILLAGNIQNAVVTGNMVENVLDGVVLTHGYAGDGANTMYPSGTSLHHNRIVNNTNGLTWDNTTVTLTAENNWWGCNEGPGQPGCDTLAGLGTVVANPWLVMNVSALPSPLIPGSTFTFTADLTDNSALADTSDQGYLPNGILINFTPIDKVNPDSAALALGVASTQATLPVTPTTFDLCAVLDNETTCREVEIIQPTHTWADDDWVGWANGTVVNWGAGNHFIGYDAFAAVQPAVAAVAAGGTVTVRPGTYLEQVSLTKSLTLSGETDQVLTTTIQAPPTIPVGTDPASNIVLVSGAGVIVEITGLTISGPGPGTSGSLGTGIFVRDGANANIHNNRVLDIRDSTLSSAQTGIAIQVGSQTLATTGTATIANNTITGYQKSGIAVNLTGSSATISNNTITGAGPTTVIAQRGIQVTYGATANITANTVSAHSFTGAGGSAIGIFLYGSSANTTANTLNENFYGIYQMGGSGTHDGNLLSATAVGVGASSYYGISISNAQAVAPMIVTVSNNDLNGNVAGYPGVSVFGGYTTHNISLTVRNNYLRNWQQGITTSCLPPGCPTSGYPIVLAEKNSITSSSTYALALYTVPGVVDARLNWWGSNTGPTYADNPGGAGGVISADPGAVTFSPWLCSATDSQPAETGFQPGLDAIKCGLPAKLVFTTQPGGALINQPLTPQPAVTARDADGNLAINFTGAVTAAIDTNPIITGSLAGTLTKSALNGVATFTDLSIDRAAVGYTLSAASAGLTSAVSSAFTISNPLPVLTAISPTWVRHGTDYVVITLTGTGFAYNAEARWNGVSLTVNEQTNTMIRAYVPGSLLTTVGNMDITVFNPTPDGGLSDAKVFSIVNETNISMTKTDGLTTVKGGETVTYTLVVSNAGPDVLTGGTLSDPIPADLTDVTWSCAATGTDSLCAVSGSGNTLLDTVDIAVGGSLTYTITGSLPNQVSGWLTNTATLTLPALYADTDGLGLTATDTTLLGANFKFYLPITLK